MAAYSSEEVQAAIDKFLLGAMSMPKTRLGSRDVLSARDDIYALLTTTLLLRPSSYFYVIWLAKNRLEALRLAQVTDLDYLLSASTRDALVRRGKPVESVTELVNAQASLLNINAGMNAASGSSSRNLGPEVDRFGRSIEKFITAALVPNVVSAGSPAETAGEARANISARWAAVLVRHGQIQDLCTAIQGALLNLNQAHLPEKAIQAVVTRLQARLRELIATLPADTSLGTHREAMLDLLVMRTLLQQVGAFRLPLETLAPLVGDGTMIQADGEAAPAQVVGSISGPFTVPAATALSLVCSGAVSVMLPASAPLSSNDIECSDIIATGGGPNVQLSEVRTEYGNFEGITDLLGVLHLTGFPNSPAVPAGTRVKVTCPSDTAVVINSGYYTVLSSLPGELTLTSPFASGGKAVSAFVFSSFLAVASAVPLVGITANPASAGATLLGLTVTPTLTMPDLSSFYPVGAVDFLLRGVEAGDILTVNGSSAALTAVTQNTLQSVAAPNFSGALPYTIQSVRYLSWLALVQIVEIFLSDSSLQAADFAVTRILTGAAPAFLLGPSGPVQVYADAIAALGSIQGYSTPFERGVDNILKMLVEQGFDRAADLFTTLQAQEFFGMHPDGASYSTQLIRTAADVTRQVAPVSKYAQSIFGAPEVRLRSRSRSG